MEKLKRVAELNRTEEKKKSMCPYVNVLVERKSTVNIQHHFYKPNPNMVKHNKEWIHVIH